MRDNVNSFVQLCISELEVSEDVPLSLPFSHRITDFHSIFRSVKIIARSRLLTVEKRNNTRAPSSIEKKLNLF